MLGVVVRNDVAQSQFSSGHVNWSAKRTEQSLGAKLVQVLLRSGKAGNYASWAILLEEAANRIFSAALRADKFIAFGEEALKNVRHGRHCSGMDIV